MTPPPIASLEKLHEALQAAVELELAIIPPYLCAWWTIRDGGSRPAHLVAEVAVDEMRHLAVAANTLVATGGQPDLRPPCSYPAQLRVGGEPAELSLLPFGDAFVEQARRLERPAPVPEGLLTAPPPGVRLLAMGEHYGSVGAFYQAIVEGIERLVDERGEACVFPGRGRTERQCRWFGNQDIAVPGAAAALRHLGDLIVEGEGEVLGVCESGSVAHYYRFEGMQQGREYRCGDAPGRPTGPSLPCPADVEVVPMVRDPRMGDYEPRPRLHRDAAAFNAAFTAVLGDLDAGFDGEPAKVTAAVGRMLQLREAAGRVLRHPHPCGDGRAGPTFEKPPA
ncbi:MAG TPA: ferritin-like protein [Acidimicrobiales bacterium]|nr:ferritin-like protein [Acidimicrobiales bacterium]